MIDKNAQTIAKIISYLEYAVFGPSPPSGSKDNTENIDIRDRPLLESKEEVEKGQQGQGLKILTPQQMITRLPILLAQLKAANNSNKLKNEIRQIIYSLHRSKNLSN